MASLVVGLMSGTSLDGVDAVLLETDGQLGGVPPRHIAHTYVPYPDDLRTALLYLCRFYTARSVSDPAAEEMAPSRPPDHLSLEKQITLFHSQAVVRLLKEADVHPSDVKVIGFHGQTIIHRPDEGFTWQIGNGALLCEMTGIPVVNDFRARDMAAGGQGAPILPVYHAALAGHLLKTMAASERDSGIPDQLQGSAFCVLNLGGVANLTHIAFPEDRKEHHHAEMVAFDTGPGCALMNDWMSAHQRGPMDDGGAVARRGALLPELLNEWTGADHAKEYLLRPAPKSLDRNSFETVMGTLEHAKVSLEDGMRTLLEMTVAMIKKSAELLEPAPGLWLVSGGGRRNTFLVERLTEALAPAQVKDVDAVGWDGDMLEAEGIAFLALRTLKQEPLTFPSTTGCRVPVTGGTIHYHSPPA